MSVILPRAMLFDMDGTLTVPTFDFPRVREAMGLEPGVPILEALAKFDEARRRQAEVILHRFEDDAAAMAALNPGCEGLLRWLGERQVRTALVTRNRRDSVSTLVRRYDLKIDVLISREDGRFKPDPAPLLLACERLGVAPQEAWMIGDGQYDVEAGLAAGTPTVWVSHGRRRPFAAEPWRTVMDLVELQQVLGTCEAR